MYVMYIKSLWYSLEPVYCPSSRPSWSPARASSPPSPTLFQSKLSHRFIFFFKYGMICNSEEPSVPLNISGHFPQRLIVCFQLVWDRNQSQLTAYQPIVYLINWCRQDVCKLLLLPKNILCNISVPSLWETAPFTVGAFPNSLSIFTSAKKSFSWYFHSNIQHVGVHFALSRRWFIQLFSPLFSSPLWFGSRWEVRCIYRLTKGQIQTHTQW